MTKANGFAALKPGGSFESIEVTLPELGPDDVEIDVEACGICHSDLSMLDNDWALLSIHL